MSRDPRTGLSPGAQAQADRKAAFLKPILKQFNAIPKSDIRARFEFASQWIGPGVPGRPKDWVGAWAMNVIDFMTNEEFNGSDTMMLARTGPWAV